jgi:hypothetical protein
VLLKPVAVPPFAVLLTPVAVAALPFAKLFWPQRDRDRSQQHCQRRQCDRDG